MGPFYTSAEISPASFCAFSRTESLTWFFVQATIRLSAPKFRSPLRSINLLRDVFTKAKCLQVMSWIRGRGNKETEIALGRLLRQNKISGWRRHRRVIVERRKSKAEGKTPSSHRRSTLVFRL